MEAAVVSCPCIMRAVKQRKTTHYLMALKLHSLMFLCFLGGRHPEAAEKAANTTIKHKVIVVDVLAIGRLLVGHTKNTWSNIRTDLI